LQFWNDRIAELFGIPGSRSFAARPGMTPRWAVELASLGHIG